MSITRTKLKSELSDKLILFTLSGDTYALDYTSVLQIIQDPSITPVANSENYFLGSTAYHGNVLPVIDLQGFFYNNNLVEIKDSLNGLRSFMVVKYEGKNVIFLVENVIGIIEKSSGSLTSDFLNLSGLEESHFFEKAFFWHEQIAVQLRVAKIFEHIINELQYNNSQYLSKYKALTTSLSIPESIEGYNIDLQYKDRISTPALSWGNEGPSRSPQKIKYTGTVVSVQNLTILVPNNQLVQIFNVTHLTEIPNAPEAVIGAINYHGDVINALDLSKIVMDNTDDAKSYKSRFQANTKVLILQINNQKVALFVDNIVEILEIDESEIRQTLVLDQITKTDYIFQGAILEKSGQMILVLNVDYLFKQYYSLEAKNESDSHVICFKNPENYSYHRTPVSLQEGLLFQDEGHYYFINEESISQVIAQDSFLRKEFTHNAIKGATIHNNINPLIDFNYLLRGEGQSNRHIENKLGILVQDSSQEGEFTILVDNVLGKISVNQFEVFQKETNFSINLASPIVSGFFSYQEKLGIIINPLYLSEEVSMILDKSAKLENKGKDFTSSLLPSEIETLEKIKTERKEWESLLFSSQEGERLDFFVFKWKEYSLAFDISLIQRVFSSSFQSRNIDSSFHPIVGVSTIENEELPVLDLRTLIIKGEKSEEISKDSSFFLMQFHDQSYLIPTDRLEGVISSFKEDLVPCEDSSIFLDGEEGCNNYLSYDNNSSLAYIIENDYVTRLLSQNKINKLLKKLNIKKTKKEE
ncbi:MAG: chemotaxis protein CheW [Candidatus Hodarchaeales archaeon]|jgi:chemotaxis signal transduction protein